MLRFFNDNKPYILFVLPLLLGGFLACQFFLEGQNIPTDIPMGLWGNVALSQALIPYSLALGYVLQLVIAITINFIFNETNCHERNNYLPSLLSITLMAALPNYVAFNSLHMTILGLLFCLQQMLKLDQNNPGGKHLFNAAFFYSISTSFFPVLIFGIPILYVLGLIFRPFILRELSIFLLGPILVSIYVFAFRAYFEVPYFWRDVYSMHERLVGNSSAYFLWTFILSMVLVTIYSLSAKWNSFSNRARKELQLLLGVLLGISLCLWVNIHFALGLLVLPLTMLFTLTFLDKRTKSWSSVISYGLWTFIFVKFLFKT